MIDHIRTDPQAALTLCKRFAENEGRPWKVCQIGGTFHVRKISTKGSYIAIYHPLPKSFSKV